MADAAADGPREGPDFPYYLRARPRLWEPIAEALGETPEDRRGQPCRVLARGSRNSILVEFRDGHRMITSGWFIRRQRFSGSSASTTPETTP